MNTQYHAQRYRETVKREAPKSKVLLQCIKAFCIGGLICLLGQGISDIYERLLHLSREHAATATSMTLVFLAALLTGFGVYDRIGSFAGAGTVVPITGFANSVVAPAMEFRAEGLVLGVGAKLFTLAGPVLVYGITASVVYGLIYWLFTQT